MKPYRIFLAIDNTTIREELHRLLGAQSDMAVVGSAGRSPDTWELQMIQETEVMILDSPTAESGWLSPLLWLQQTCPDVRVLALVVSEDEQTLQQLFNAGASGYILKRPAGDELLNGLRTVASGGIHLGPVLMKRAFSGYVETLRGTNVNGHEANMLSSREKEVVSLIALGHSQKEIAAQLHISIKTVDTYKVRLMNKLNLANRVDLVRFAVQQGWLNGK